MDLLKIILIGELMLFPAGQLVRLELGNGLTFLLNDIIVGILFISWIAYLILKKKKLSSPMLKPIAVFVSIGFLSLLLNSRFLNGLEFFVSFSYLLRFIIYVSLYFIIKSFSYNFKKKVVFLLITSGAIIITEGYIQYFFYTSLRNLYYLGWDEHLYRMFSAFLDPNFAGSFFVLYLLLLLGLILRGKENAGKKIRIIATFLAILTTASAFLTYSRSTLIMLLVSLVTFLIVKKMKRWIFVVLAVFLLFVLLNSKNSSIENLNLFRVVSSEARLKSAKEAINIIKKQPILGVGYNSYRYAQIRFGTRGGKNALVSHADAGTDNSFLFVLATTGIVGLVSFLFIWKKFLSLVAAGKEQDSPWLKPVILSSLVGIFISSLFINSLFYPFIMTWLFTILGLYSSEGSKFKENR